MASPDAETIGIQAIAKVLITDETASCQERMRVSRRTAGSFANLWTAFFSNTIKYEKKQEKLHCFMNPREQR